MSDLPVYIANRSESFPAFLLVQCPRQDCPSNTGAGRPFLVAEKEWMRPMRRKGVVFVGRSCPYCFKVGRLPKRSDIN
jgi:hypothetical protein